ncbi:MAG: transketolase C-terminal domain-containing protein [bacterium]|nr:transketolase C-terminal domain-containing protein [bacterium]
MINPSQKLNPKIFDKDVERISVRKGFGEGLVNASDLNKNVVGLCADLVESTGMEIFKNKYPDRFIEIGIAEQNMASTASGMAAMGKIPFMASYAIFSPGRNWEQIRTTICYNDRPVKIVATHAGVNVGPDGGSHQALEDIALMRVLPNMTVFAPCDYIEARKIIMAVAKTKGPVYIRLSREKTPVITTNATPFEIGKGQIFFAPDAEKNNNIKSENNVKIGVKENIKKADVGIITTGDLLHNALLAASKLEKENISIKVLHLATIKPLDEKAVLDLAHETKALVTVEEHQMFGGLGSTISEFLSQNYPTLQEFIAVKDKFGQSGTSSELREFYGLGVSHIYNAVKRILLRKS